ncbi:fimbrial protein [Providencia rustigianii]|uniref:fimbrial protein n=1 Tax=Providencia rustigianii TaxID=158850 RepID=UPI00223F3F96|nr:fimbrial protein [Providencia rustigianii]
MMIFIKIIKKRVFLLFTVFINTLIIFFSGFCFAETYSLTIKVDVIESTCDIYGNDGPGNPIEVSFGEMNLNGFTSERYTRDIHYAIDCGGNTSSNPNLKLKFESDISDFDATLVKTSNPRLGLKIQADNKLLSPNEYRNFTYSNKPLLSVSPVLDEGKKIEFGAFTAIGRLKVEYQ